MTVSMWYVEFRSALDTNIIADSTHVVASSVASAIRKANKRAHGNIIARVELVGTDDGSDNE